MDKLIIGAIAIIAFICNYEPSAPKRPEEVEQIAPIAPAFRETIEMVVTAADIADFLTCKGQERQTAIHEAGHFFLYLQKGIGITEATIVPKKGQYGGFVRPLKSDDVANAGGYAAEIMFLSHDKTVEDFIRREGLLDRYQKSWDNGKLFHTDRQAFYDLVVEACKQLKKHEKEVFTIASYLYKKKKLNQNDCHDLSKQILNKEGNGQ